VIDMAVFDVIDPDALPNFTAVALPRLVPVIVTVVPPVVGPDAGEIPVTVGPAAVYVNLSAGVFAEVPPGVVTVTSSVPVPFGDIAVILVSLTNVKLVAAV
jgi:ABC-type methionine transport system permease subunit